MSSTPLTEEEEGGSVRISTVSCCFHVVVVLGWGVVVVLGQGVVVVVFCCLSGNVCSRQRTVGMSPCRRSRSILNLESAVVRRGGSTTPIM